MNKYDYPSPDSGKDDYKVPDEYPDYWQELEEDHKKENGYYDE